MIGSTMILFAIEIFNLLILFSILNIKDILKDIRNILEDIKNGSN